MQEDPYKLIVLGKDPYHSCVTRADLFFANGHLSIVTCDEEGIIRVYVYDPHGMYIVPPSITCSLCNMQILIQRMGSTFFVALSSMAKQSTGVLYLWLIGPRPAIRKYPKLDSSVVCRT